MAKNPIPRPGQPIQLGEFLLGDHRHPAVYFLHDEGEIVYVGQTTTLKWRIETHLREGVKTFDAVSFAPCCVSRLFEVEGHYIRKLVPTYNQCTVAKSVRFEDSLISDNPPIRVIDGQDCVGSLGLSRIMLCSRPFAKQLIAMTGKDHVTLGEAFQIAMMVREPTEADLAGLAR